MLRQHVAVGFIQAQFSAHHIHRALVITGEHNKFADAKTPEALQIFLHTRADQIPNADIIRFSSPSTAVITSELPFSSSVWRQPALAESESPSAPLGSAAHRNLFTVHGGSNSFAFHNFRVFNGVGGHFTDFRQHCLGQG